MNASYAWLKELVPFTLSPEELRDLITERCATVDDIERLRNDLRDVVVGLVVEAGPHPDSDRLSLTRVDAGGGELLEVVCGAPNVRAGARYPFAPVGTTLPGGLKLEKRKIRGVVSNGMLCSARELALGEDGDGILELVTDAAPGTPFLNVQPVGDTRLVIDVTPNRPDLLSHFGVAREIAAATGLPLRLADVSASGTSPGGSDGHAERLELRRDASRVQLGEVAVELRDQQGCPRYMGAVIRGVQVGPSPAWLVERLASVGSRSINNVVDITNYLMHELGQPMHAFDLARLAGPAIVIRPAGAGERMRTLDGVERTLDDSMTVIADGERPQAVAGVMGGEDSEVDARTRDIFLEVAHFDPAAVRRTRRKLGLSTDSSYRFERGTDPILPPVALARAVRMLEALTGGRLDGPAADLRAREFDGDVVELRPARVSLVLGAEIPAPEIERLLTSIGFGVTGSGDTLSVRVPTWRPDVVSEIDLLEEVARLRGYGTFSDELRSFRLGTTANAIEDDLAKRARSLLAAEGLLETRPMPFIAGRDADHVRVANPLAENEAHLRRDLLESLARRAEHNLAHMQRTVRLFEVGHAFAPAGSALPREELRAAALQLGDRRPSHWSEPQPPQFDAWDAKALAETLARSVAGPGARVELRPGNGDELWEVAIDEQRRGTVRRLALDAPVWAAPAFGVELTLAQVPSDDVAPHGEARYGERLRHRTPERTEFRFRPLPITPAAEFDLALLVPNAMKVTRVEEVIRESAGELLESLVLFDEYRGKPVPDGFRSVAWRLTFRHPERTLREKEIAGRREKLLRTLEGELGVRQRTT
jgi:phenylalanyl-tRNA synthetase beta chain